MKRHSALARFIDPDKPAVRKSFGAGSGARFGGSGEACYLSGLQAFGRVLAEHIRREERELFPLHERALPDAALRQWAAELRG